jgi:lysophospholipase L1-like esterase
MKKLLVITIPAVIASSLVIAALIEITIRVSWDPVKGQPGFLVSDPVRLEKLASNYDGWFAGVPVHTNSLGFRDSREYQLEKQPGTFRILVLGDSVTFGHGSVYEHTYPLLLEQKLKAWKPRVDWQVWNLGVPGYNTSQELANLLEVGAAFRPDLVIVGFYGNDLVDNRRVTPPTKTAVVVSSVKTWFKRHMYSFDLYKKVALTLVYRLRTSHGERELLENLAAQDRLLAKPSAVAQLKEQQLTDPPPLPAGAAGKCSAPAAIAFPVTMPTLQMLLGAPEIEMWKDAVRRLQQLNRDGTYRIVFFVNDAPAACQTGDVFDPRATKEIDDYFLRMLSDGTPAVSSHDAFARYRPSQMPEAAAHSIGNSNALKASVLFEFLRDRVLPRS